MSLTKDEQQHIKSIINSGKSSINDLLKDSKERIEEAKQILREKAAKKGIRHNL